MRARLTRLILAVFLPLAACATTSRLTTDQQVNLEVVQRFVEETRRVYNLPPIRILVSDHYAGTGAVYYDTGLLTVEPSALSSQYRDALFATMLAYALIPRETTFERMLTQDDWQKRQVRRSLEANAKAVEILQRVRGWPERTSLDHVPARLVSFLELEQAGHKVPTPGHLRPCAELADLWKRFPAYTPADSVPRCYGPDVPK
jgi:hypothetical protein